MSDGADCGDDVEVRLMECFQSQAKGVDRTMCRDSHCE